MPVINTSWQGEIDQLKESTILEYNPNMIDSDLFMEELHQYIKQHSLEIDLAKENVNLGSNFNHKTQYFDKHYEFQGSETNIDIYLDTQFEYKETLIIKDKKQFNLN